MTGYTFGDEKSWPIGEYILGQLPIVHKLLIRAKYSDVRLCIPEYFHHLRRRRLLAIEFAKTDTLTVVFVGRAHTFNPESKEETAIAKTSSALAVKLIAPYGDESIFLFEQGNEYIGNGVVTEAMLVNEVWRLLKETNPGAPRKLARRQVTASQDVIYKLITDRRLIFTGEEWPLMANYSLIHLEQQVRKVLPAEDRRVCHLEVLQRSFTVLRSEIIVLRALEKMKETGKRQAVIIQGAMHGNDMSELSDVYGFHLTLISAVPR